MTECTVVVPCFDEAHRLPVGRFEAFVQKHPDVGFLLVDDGSRDDTLARLRELSERDPDHFEVLELAVNRGKAEAVRCGVAMAMQTAPRYLGYWDADLATPLEEIPRFVELLETRPQLELVLGARVKLLGRQIERNPLRHALGRAFATAAAAVLELPVHDSQCGAKLFRATPANLALFEEPFLVGWTFDVELLARLVCDRRARGETSAAEVVYELPVQQWRDVPGSKVRPWDFLHGLFELLRIRRRYFAR